MTPTRREFIKSVGLALAGLVLARCVPSPSPQGGDTSARSRLRDCWLRFDWLAAETRKTWDSNDYDGPREQLLQEHQSALEELVNTGELTRAVADELLAGFNAAAYHVWRSNVPITCYEPVMIDYQPTSAAQLVRQAEVLEELARGGSIDADTVATAQETITRDIAFLTLSNEQQQALYEEILAGGSPYPDFSEIPLDIAPEEAEAAQYLVELLLGER
ncbi:MAG: hypothetical protein JW900_12600 [Anaerolineae bacterium]|nr:hypothetical protein [Anaerolineae bacterium]